MFVTVIKLNRIDFGWHKYRTFKTDLIDNPRRVEYWVGEFGRILNARMYIKEPTIELIQAGKPKPGRRFG